MNPRCVLSFLGITLSLAAAAQAATPVAWFKADGLALNDGSPVTLWKDSSNHGYPARGNNPPTYSATGMNGRPALHFDADNGQFLVFPRPVQDDFTIVVVFKSTQGVGSGNDFYSGAGLVSGEVAGVTVDFGISLKNSGRVLAGTGAPDVTVVSDRGFNDGEPHIVVFSRDVGFGSSALSLYVDGTLQGSANGTNQSLVAPSELTIGAQPGAYNFLDGDIAEILVYNVPFTQSDATSITNALRGKYGLSSGAAPAAPEAVTAQESVIRWVESIGATSYDIQRATAQAGPYTTIATSVTGNRYLDTTAEGGNTYWYRLVAKNGFGSSAPSVSIPTTMPVLPENGPTVINEIHYNGLSNVVRSDFIELYNYSSSPRDISGWRLSSGIDYTFPPNTIIPAGGYLVVAEDPATVEALWGVEALGPYDGGLSSDGERIRLRNASNNTVAEINYSSGFPWPCAANGEGASAELINPALDPALGSSWRASIAPETESSYEVASPGARNHQYRENPPPNIENVTHTPQQPTSNDNIVVTARVTDPDSVTNVQLRYQIVTPGNYIPAHLPLPIINHNINVGPLPPNPAFEDPANWTTVAMRDDGINGDQTAGDGIYTGTIPKQDHRTLVRYRIVATDGQGVSDRAPFADDKSRNFACFVYNGVPDYQGVSSATLQSLPVYHFLTRKQDYDQCVAYDSQNQLTGGTPAWTFENWEAALVFDGVVYDHIRYRLHGGNGRYYHRSKRAFRFFFNEGYDFQNRDNDGNPYPTKWNSLTTENGWENRGTLTYSLNEVINFYLFNLIGVPAPYGNWGHFRIIDTAEEQPDPWHGDFWGLIYIHEDYDRRFLDSHNLEKGNLYKLTRDGTDGPSQQRYQAPGSVSDGSDHYNIYHNLQATSSTEFINAYVNVKQWSTYHALCHAIRHYDYWPTGDNNAAYYFEPNFEEQEFPYGRLWTLPNDVDATWGPTWNEGKDIVWRAIFDPPANPEFYPTYFNAVREIRDLLWQPDQINPLIDQFAAVIAPFVVADNIRWKNAPDDAGNYNGLGGAGATSLAALVEDMKKFAWVGGSWPGGDVDPGGTAALLDNLQRGVSNSEASTIPNRPTLTYSGPAGYPTSELRFTASPFSDPQGSGTFAAAQWRVAEVTNPDAPAYDPEAKLLLEWNATFDTGPIASSATTFTFPATACKSGHAYRARVRYMDNTGRWSRWSEPVEFIAGDGSAISAPLVISEFLYKPDNPTPTEVANGFNDQEMFEYVEVLNVSDSAVNLQGYKLAGGIDFTFPANTILQPGARLLVVSDAAAFAFRYGAGKPVVGQYSGHLKNSGEQILLTDANGTPLVDFTYSDSPPWPTEADTGGYSLVLKKPFSRPDPNVATNWRASRVPGGAPGEADGSSYASWAAEKGISADPNADDDGDGISNQLEYALALNANGADRLPIAEPQPLFLNGAMNNYLVLTFTRRLDADDAEYHVEFSNTLSNWVESPTLLKSIDNGDGTATQTWRSAQPISGGAGFMRVRISGVGE